MSELARIETVLHLQTVGLFEACNAEQIMRISAITRQRELAADEVLFRAGERADALYCLVRGSVAVDGGEGEPLIVDPPGTLGIDEILSGRLRAGTARAREDCLTLVVAAEDFFDLLANNIGIVKAIFRQLLKRS